MATVAVQASVARKCVGKSGNAPVFYATRCPRMLCVSARAVEVGVIGAPGGCSITMIV